MGKHLPGGKLRPESKHGKSNSPGGLKRITRQDGQGLQVRTLAEVVELSSPVRAPNEAAIHLRLSPERLWPYLESSGGHLTSALQLYAWNAQISAAFFEEIHYLEIVLRNAFSQRLTAMHQESGRPNAWYDQRDWFSLEGQLDIEKARERVAKAGRQDTPGQMLTELNFGFWRYLLANQYHRSLWEPSLRHAFPNLGNAIDRRREVERLVSEVYLLRNRIAHHEPIHRRDLLRDHESILDVIGWICRDTRAWVETHGRVVQLTGTRPYAAGA